MTRPENNWAARRRSKLNRDRGYRQLSQAVDALRRLNAQKAASTRAQANPLGSSERRHSYLTQSHD